MVEHIGFDSLNDKICFNKSITKIEGFMTEEKQLGEQILQPQGGSKEYRKTMKIALVITSILALSGVGLNIWQYLNGNIQRDKINSEINALKKENNDLKNNKDKTNTSVEKDIKYVFSADNATGLNKSQNMTVSSATSVNIKYLLGLDGSVKTQYQWVDWESADMKNKKREGDNLTSKINGRVVDIAAGHIGNSAWGEVFFLLDDGTVAHMSEYDILSQKYNVKKITGAKDIVRVYGNLYNLDYAGFVQNSSGKIHPIVLDKWDENGNDTLKIE